MGSVNERLFLSRVGVITAAILLGVSEPLFVTAGIKPEIYPFLMTVGFLSAGILLCICFRGSIKEDKASGLLKGVLPGLLLYLVLYCLQKGGFGIVWSLSLFIILAVEMFGSESGLSARQIAAIMLSFGGLLILTDTVQVVLFPFSFAILLPKWDLSLLWQTLGSVISVFFLYIGRKTAPRAAGVTIAAGNCFTVGLIAFFVWCFAKQAEVPKFDAKLTCLIAWCIFAVTTCSALIFHGIRSCHIVPCKTAFLLAPAVQLLLQLVITKQLPPEFDAAAGMLFLLAGALYASNGVKQKR